MFSWLRCVFAAFFTFNNVSNAQAFDFLASQERVRRERPYVQLGQSGAVGEPSVFKERAPAQKAFFNFFAATGVPFGAIARSIVSSLRTRTRQQALAVAQKRRAIATDGESNEEACHFCNVVRSLACVLGCVCRNVTHAAIGSKG